jgi:hypothetical protein
MIQTHEFPPAEKLANHANGWTVPASPPQTRRRWSNANRKTLIITAAASVAIVGLGATNIITALNASAADAAHHREVVALKAAHEREIHQIRTKDGLLLTNTISQLKTHEHNALLALKTADGKAAKKAADVAYSRGHSSGYSSGYGAGNSAGYSAGNSAGYSAGNSAGYSSGYSNGNAAGYSSGYNNGAASAPAQQCSNDPSVTWLPYCS